MRIILGGTLDIIIVYKCEEGSRRHWRIASNVIAELRHDHDLRKAAMNRFFREHLRWAERAAWTTDIYELDDLDGLKMLQRLLDVNLVLVGIRESLKDYVEGKKDLHKTYEDFLPLMISKRLGNP